MAKKNSLLNMLLSLTLICLVSGGVIAGMNELTREPIAMAKQASLENAIRAVVPEFDNSPSKEMYKAAIAPNDTAMIYPAKLKGELVGIAIETNSLNGFNGEVRILTGLLPTGEIINYEVLSHAETPGLGSKMDLWFKTDKNKQSIIGKNLSTDVLKLSKDGGDVDAITASTITSRAFIEAVNKAYAAYSGQADGTSDATTSATTN